MAYTETVPAPEAGIHNYGKFRLDKRRNQATNTALDKPYPPSTTYPFAAESFNQWLQRRENYETSQAS